VAKEVHLAAALKPLPVAALRVTPELCFTLAQVGIETIAHLLALKRENLLVRFGDDPLRRLDQAFGRISEQIQPFHMTEAPSICRVFDGGTTQLEAIFITAKELITELSGLLLAIESGVRGMRLELKRIDMPPLSLELVLGRPSRDAKHLWKLLRARVEKAHLGHGVEAVSLTAFWTQTIRHQQIGAWNTGVDAQDEEYDAFLDTLVNRWGTQRVLAAHPVASHVPEVARQFRPVREPLSVREAGTHALVFMDRPSVLLDKPEPAHAVVLQPDHPPRLLVWRGEEHRVVPQGKTGGGAERIVTTWWSAKTPSTRDYFKVQTLAGLWLWVFREHETARWFVHGLWA
jgi:protein ImuB